MKNKGTIAITQIALLIIAIFAFAWMIGDLGVVNASAGDNDDSGCTNKGGKCTAPISAKAGDSCDGGKGKVEIDLCNSPAKKAGYRCCVPIKSGSGEGMGLNVNTVVTGLTLYQGVRMIKQKVTAQGAKQVIKKVAEQTSTTLINGITNSALKKAAEEAAKKATAKALSRGLGTAAQEAMAKAAVEGVIAEGMPWYSGFTGQFTSGWGSAAMGVLHIVGAASTAYVLSRLAISGAQGWGWNSNEQIIFGSVIGGLAAVAYIFYLTSWGGPVAWIGGGIATLTILLTSAGVKEQGTVVYNCQMWQPEKGGKNCELCNNNELDVPCSEYQCKSLGQGCDFLHDEETGESLCVWDNRNDISPPVIEADETKLLPGHKYIPDTKFSSTKDRGVEIVPIEYKEDSNNPKEKCISPYEVVSFGVKSDEPMTCKWEMVRKTKYEDMENILGGSTFPRYSKGQSISIPEITEGMETDYSIYVRCEDRNGNYNKANLIFSFCIDDRIDTIPPEIIQTDPLNEAPLPFNTSELDVDVFIDKPGTCNWARKDKSYEQMEFNMSCSLSPTTINGRLAFKCTTKLSGFSTQHESKFYFKCKNNPKNPENERFAMKNSYVYVLTEARNLHIIEVTPNNTNLGGPKPPFKVEITAKTQGGNEEGRALCWYGFSDETDAYSYFENTASHEHSHDFWAQESGTYDIFIKCADSANNIDKTKITFDVELDSQTPIISRVYREGNQMKIITHEAAVCVYSTNDCSYPFEEGASTNSIKDDTVHYFDWDPETDFFIKCEDKYGNRPLFVEECSIIVRAQE